MTINLLPRKEKNELEKEKNWKKVFIILIFILIFILFLILIFFSLKIYLHLEIQPLETALLEKRVELTNFQPQEFQQLISRTNENLSKIQKFWQEQILIVPIFEKISSLTSDSIYFTNLSFEKITQGEEEEKESFIGVHIDGRAENREKLFYFKEKLEKEKDFEEVYFLPSSWIEPVNAEFSLTFISKINVFK